MKHLLRKIICRLAYLLGCAWLLPTCAPAQDNFGFPVQTTVAQGTLEGRYSTRTGVQTYFGIPFAAPPVGELRWQPPQSPADWEGVRDATRFGPRAVQRYVFDDMRFRSPRADEDCLYLNVWTPARKGDEDLSVLVYFHGGGNVSGSGDELRYDGEALAREGIIVVTANYRLGVWGFFAHPELTAEQGRSGNYGMLDQVAALEWVRENIAAFGGDPERITIAGESAGSMDVSVLMSSPLSRDLLAGAVGESGAAIAPTAAPVSQAEAEAQGKDFLRRSGYPSIAALRGAPTRDIYETAYAANYNYRGGFVLDGYLLEASLPETFAAGKQAQIPLMVGWTSAEMAWMPAPEDAAAYEAQVGQRFGDRAAEALELYPAKDFHRSAVALGSDNWIVYGTWKWAELHRRYSDQPVYRYRFDKVRPPLKGQTRETEPVGAAHATDIEYFMNSLDKSDAYAWAEADRKAAKTMSVYLVNFVKTGDPNGGDLPKWQPLGEGEATPVMHLDAESELRMSEAEGRYRFLEGVYEE